jgi:IS605 OrfB family transposase
LSVVPRQRPFGAGEVVYRSARVELRVSPAKRERCFALLAAGGDVWSCVLELSAIRRRRSARPIASYQALCRELSFAGPGCFGELSSVAARSVLRRYSDAYFAAAKARRAGDTSVRYPRRRRHLMSLGFYAGTFSLEGRCLTLPVARACAPLVVSPTRPVPYDEDQVRSVTLGQCGGRLYVEVTAEVPVQANNCDPARIAGVDLGIIHPYALATENEGLLVSGRALRAECRLHLADSKARSKAAAQRAPKNGQRGSRRWRKVRARQRVVDASHRRRISQAHHEAAREVIAWALERRVGTLVVGHPAGIARRDAGRHQNLAVHNWRMAHLLQTLADKAEVAGIAFVAVDERGTSSTCPECKARTSKPKGRSFTCASCGHRGHRDRVGARNIAARGGGSTSAPALVTHRRAGRHLPDRMRRDPGASAWPRERVTGRPWPAPGTAPGSRSSSLWCLTRNRTRSLKRANVGGHGTSCPVRSKLPDLPEDRIADVMAERIVDLFKGINVSDDACQFGVPSQLFVKEAFEQAPISEASEGVLFRRSRSPPLLEPGDSRGPAPCPHVPERAGS